MSETDGLAEIRERYAWAAESTDTSWRIEDIQEFMRLLRTDIPYLLARDRLREERIVELVGENATLYKQLKHALADNERLYVMVAKHEEEAPLLKDASEVTAIWDLTGGEDPVEHIRRMRDDSDDRAQRQG